VIEWPRNKVSTAYNYAKYLDDRKRMMQDRADYLDEQLNMAKRALHSQLS
jgi:hypothetical protein